MNCSNRVTLNLVFFSLSDPTIAYCINQNELVPSELLPKHQITSSQIWVLWNKDLANVPLKDVSMERVRVKEFEESKDEDYGWVNLFFLWGFSLKILSESSLRFVGIKAFIVGCVWNAKSQLQPNRVFWRLELATRMSRELTAWLDWKFSSVVQ